jgi:hypothetical protein
MPREASPRWVGAPRPAEEETGRLVRSGDSEAAAETTTSLLADSEDIGADTMHGGGPFYSYTGGGWMGWMGRLVHGS